jgi:hypothetical protein
VPSQVALTVVAPLRAGSRGAVDEALLAAAVPFEQLQGVHFARVLALDLLDENGGVASSCLVLMSDVDAPLERHLQELAGVAGAALDPVLAHCEGYPQAPDPAARLAFLRGHRTGEAASYVNTVGRGVEQVMLESRLRTALEDELDRRGPLPPDTDPLALRRELQCFVGEHEALHPALQPAAPPELSFRIREAVHLVSVPLLGLVLLPVTLLSAPFVLLALRWHEQHDVPDTPVLDEERVEALRLLEDRVAQNPFAAYGRLKPGLFRRAVASTVLTLTSYAARHVFNDGNLAGVKTIHFARWVFLDDKRSLVFTSNYDGSLESYMDDFIDKVWWGLNAVFSNGLGYPRTRWLLLGGSRDEVAFKDYLRAHQEPVHVWYSAYPDLTARNLRTNAQIRAGLSGDMDAEQAAAWLRLL